MMKLTTEFLYAGRASFVVANPKGESVTVKLNKGKDKINPETGQPYEPSFFLKLRHQNHQWKYVGIVNPFTGVIKRTRASELTTDAREVKIAHWAMELIRNGESVPDGYRLEHTGRCGKCGKMLRDQDSIERGLGPTCAGRR